MTDICSYIDELIIPNHDDTVVDALKLIRQLTIDHIKIC